ncbi:NAD+ synthase [Methylophilus medardicus]|uniref:Glutamine-dependent NAD(+) synthetase n=1 Tax=Methylophilus medardicus TaxID=2588534 RepID=A0A5B8CRK4_9PROT|nr:NAD+ synthase [Methylophilus medardicus]QDC43676.1 NAD+ synthase [Methylophilus medardicus]QDC48683.1 NAD+ synthase [Methylophilus medardicus]QDC52388.1 NAD+ synthase [Methylophilus medardicus]
MKLAIAQMNCMVGAMQQNAEQILALADQAYQAGARLLLTPELALCGYPPEDLLFRQDFHEANQRALQWLEQRLPADMAVIVGHPHALSGKRYNAASVIHSGRIQATYHKHHLPNYSVFDEERYFEAGELPVVFEWHGVRYGLLICADSWVPGPALQALQAEAQVLLTINASPYHLHKQTTRYQVLRDRIKETGLPMIYANLVGGQDELVFDGASFSMNSQGTLVQEMPMFEAHLGYLTLQDNQPLATDICAPLSTEATVYKALMLGLRDYVDKNKFPAVVLGLSGGIDSALTLAIAVDALGKERVKAVMMPSTFTAGISVEDAAEMARLLDVDYSVLPIAPLFDGFCETLAETFAGKSFDTTEENLQARIRGMLLMAISNKFGSLVLTTGNKSETAVGYSTLYGDMAGGFALIKDVPKTLVYRLAVYRNQLSAIIPERIITRAPSAELRPDQTDQDSLPAYEVLDAIMEAYVEKDLSIDAIVNLGYSPADVERVTRLIDRNEYKRRQAAVGVRITERGFGKDRRYPITCQLKF